MADTTKITNQEKEYADIIAEKASGISLAQQIRVLGFIEGIGAANIDSAVKDENKGA